MLHWLYDLLWGPPAPPAPAVIAVAPVPVVPLVAAPALAHAHVAPPVAPVVPPPLPFPVVNPPIDPGVERRQRELAEFLAEIQLRENAAGGHVAARHHPNLTDQQLQDRLITGLDAHGAVAVTSGVSSAFQSEALFQETLRRVEELLNRGLESTRAYLRENIVAYQTTRAAAEAAQRLALPNALGHANPTLTAFRNARNDLLAAIAVTQQGNFVNNAFMLPVESGDLPAIANRYQWAASLQSYLVINLFQRYRLTVYQRKTVGRGFRGTSPRLQNVRGQQITVYGVVQPFQGSSDHTFTLLVVQGQHDLRIDRPHNARQWGVTTHFPSDERQESVSGAN
jgi:hypothetical protein